MTENLDESHKLHKGLIFWVSNFHKFIFLGLIFPGIYFFGYPKKCLGRAPLSCTCQSTLPGNKTQRNLHIRNRTFYINSYRIPYDSSYLNSNLHNMVYHQIRIHSICTFIPDYSAAFSLSPFFLKSLRPF